MKQEFGKEVEKHRIVGAGEPGTRMGGFRAPGPNGMALLMLVSDGSDWKECGLPGDPWEHVSVSLKHRCPTWSEMEFAREMFFGPEETVLQFSVPRSLHINYHPFCLHLWRQPDHEVTLPPPLTVAPAEVK